MEKVNKSAQRSIDQDLQDRKKVIQKKIDKEEIINQEVSSEITKNEFAMEKIIAIPKEESSLSYLPTLKKQLKEQEKKREQARHQFEKASKELRNFKPKK